MRTVAQLGLLVTCGLVERNAWSGHEAFIGLMEAGRAEAARVYSQRDCLGAKTLPAESAAA